MTIRKRKSRKGETIMSKNNAPDRNQYSNDLVGFSAFAQDFARKIFEEGAGFDIVVLAEKIGRPTLFMSLSAKNGEELGALAVIQSRLEKEEVERAARISEQWCVKIPKDQIPDILPRPSMHPDRKEVMRIVARDLSGKGLDSMADITRPADGTPQLGPWETIPANDGPLLGVVRTS